LGRQYIRLVQTVGPIRLIRLGDSRIPRDYGEIRLDPAVVDLHCAALRRSVRAIEEDCIAEVASETAAPRASPVWTNGRLHEDGPVPRRVWESRDCLN